MRPAHHVLLLGFALVALFEANALAQTKTTTPTNNIAPIKAPREVRIHLQKARKALEDREYHMLCDHIGELLKKEDADYFVGDELHSFGLKEEVARMVLAFDKEARDAYQLRFGAEAEAKLDKILEENNWSQLESFHQRYVGTKAGAKAALMSARLLTEQGKPAAAAMRLRRLVGSAPDLEPELSVLLASCWLQAGDRASARAALLALHNRNRPETIQLGADETAWFANESDVDDWINNELAPITPLMPKVEKRTRPKISLAWDTVTGETEQELDLLKTLRKQFIRRGVTAMPTLAPMNAGNWIVARSTRRLFGFDPNGGKRIWVYPPRPTENLDAQLTTTMAQNRQTLTASGEAIFRRTWTDGLYAGFASDGDKLYLIDRLSAPTPKLRYGRRVQVRQPGQPFWDPNTNRLVALDLNREGAMSWTVGGADGNSEKLNKAFFLSPPLVQGDQLYVLAELEQQINLYALSKEDGKIQWQQALLTLENQQISENPERRLRGGKLAVQNGVLLCWTGADYFIGIDLSERRFIWKTKLVDRDPNEKSDNAIETYAVGNRHVVNYRDPNGEWAKFIKRANPDSRWSDASLLCSQRYCITTPPTLNTVKCVDLYSGEILWSRPRRDFLYVACEFEDHVLLVGHYRMALVSLADGTPKWVTAQQTLGVPSGRGVQLGQYFYLPTSEGELLSIDLNDGAMTSTATKKSLGNLALMGDMIVSQSPTSFVAFAPQDAADDPSKNPTAPVENEQDVEKIIRLLGHKQFRVREQAERRLAVLGIAATPALKEGLADVDPELRIRCRRLLDRIARDSRTRLLVEFKKGDENSKAVLPGWKKFAELVNNDKQARPLYADMYEAEFGLLEMSEKKPEQLGQAIQHRCSELQTATQQFGYQLSLPTVATVVYLSTHDDAKKNATVSTFASSFCSQNSFRQAIANGDKSPLLKKLLVGLMENMTGTPNYQLIMLGMQYDIKECYKMARVFAENKQQSGYAKAYALFAIGRYGSIKADAAILEKNMTDKQQCTSYSINGKRYVTQVRDVALVCLLELHKLKPKEFAFVRFQKSNNQIAMHTIGFETDKERGAALEKWKAYKDKKGLKSEPGDEKKAEEKKAGEKQPAGAEKKADAKPKPAQQAVPQAVKKPAAKPPAAKPPAPEAVAPKDETSKKEAVEKKADKKDG